MKNFQDFLAQSEQTIANPFIYTTPQVQRQIQLGAMGKMSTLLLGTGLSQILTAPLQTIITSMQLSVLPHKQIFVSVESRTKQLARLNTQLTISQKRNLELMIRTGGEFQPYTAPVYTGYQQAVRNIAKQGWQAFYKGVGFRLAHSIPHFLCYGTFFKYLISKDSQKFGFFTLLAKCYGILTLTDMTLNVFHILQNRYVLQNNMKQFRGFKSISQYVSSPGQTYYKRRMAQGDLVSFGQCIWINGVEISNVFFTFIRGQDKFDNSFIVLSILNFDISNQYSFQKSYLSEYSNSRHDTSSIFWCSACIKSDIILIKIKGIVQWIWLTQCKYSNEIIDIIVGLLKHFNL